MGFFQLRRSTPKDSYHNATLSHDPVTENTVTPGERGLFAAGVFGAFKHNCMDDHAP